MAPPRRPAPAPIETNDVPVVVAGTVAWLAALIVLLFGEEELSDATARWVWVCAAGAFLGVVGLRYVTRRRLTEGHGGAASASRDELPPVEPLT